MSPSLTRNNHLKIGLACELYLRLTIIPSDFFEICINDYYYCPKLKYQRLNVKHYVIRTI